MRLRYWIYLFIMLVSAGLLMRPSPAQAQTYDIQAQDDFQTFPTIIFEGTLPDNETVPDNLVIHAGKTCSAPVLPTTIQVISERSGLSFRAIVPDDHVINRDRQIATLCQTDTQTALSTQTFVIKGHRLPFFNIALALSIGLLLVTGILLFERLNGRNPQTLTEDKSWLLPSLMFSVIPLVGMATLLNIQAVDTLIIDDWDRHLFGSYLASTRLNPIEYLSYTWTLAHEGHRIFVPALMNTALMHLTDFTLIPKYFVNLGIGFAMPWMLARMLRQHINEKWFVLLALIAFSLLLFSPSYQRWAEARMTSSLLTTVTSVGVVWALTVGKPNPISFGLAVLLAAVASNSFFPGNFTWFVGLPLLWVRGYRHPLYYILWIAAVLGVLLPLYIDIQSSFAPDRGGVPAVAEIIIATILFLAMPFLDASMTDNSIRLLMVISVLPVILISIYFVLRSRKLRQNFKAFFAFGVIIAWAGLNAGAIIFSRVSIAGVTMASTDRYEIYAIAFWGALIALLILALTEQNRGIAILLAFGIGLSWIIALYTTPMTLTTITDTERATRWCALQPPPRPDICNDYDTLEILNLQAERPKMFWLQQHRAEIAEVDSYSLMPAFAGSGWQDWMLQAYSWDASNPPIPATVDATLYTRDVAGNTVHAIRATENLYWELYIPPNVETTLYTRSLPNTDAESLSSTRYQVSVQPLNDSAGAVTTEQQGMSLQFTEMMTISLTEFAGQRVRVTLTVSDTADNDHFWQLPEVNYTLP